MELSNIGKKAQSLRLAKNMSVRKTAAAAGITPSMLSQIESGQVNPSISTLRALAGVLDTPLYSFFMEESVHTIVKPHARKTIGLKSEPDVQYELLTPDIRGSIEFIMMIIPPHLSSSKTGLSHHGEEVALMCEGDSVDLEMDGVTYTLEPGDSVRIPAETVHAWHNRKDTTVQVVFAITPPTF